MRRLAPLAISLPLLLTACGGITDSGGSQGGAGELTGVTWVLDRASMMTLVDAVPKDARIDVTFDGSQSSGLAACNRYGGTYEADAGQGTLTFSALASTQMACVGDLMDLESAYLSALGAVTGYQVTGDQTGLQLTGGTAALTFQPEQPAEALPLEGTAWTLTTIAQPERQAVSSTIAGTKVTAMFEAGSVSGSGGCNTYNGSYETGEAGSLTFGPIASTLMLCAQDVSDQEQAYFAALAKVGSYAIDGEQLTLSDGDGTMLLQFSGKAVR
jgi:heat shock protein HslJ